MGCGRFSFVPRAVATRSRASRIIPSVDAWVFFATLWFAVVAFSVPLRLVLDHPSWWKVFNAHAAMVGIVTNLLFGVVAARTRFGGMGDTWAQPAAMWLMNIGVVVFIGLFIATGSAHGALVQGIGVLLGVAWTLASLRKMSAGTGLAAQADVEPTD